MIKYNHQQYNLTNEPFVSILLLTKNNFELLKQNLESWDRVVTYSNYEIIVVDTGSDEDTIQKYNSILGVKNRLVRYEWYNFGRINNDVIKNHLDPRTELILFLNDDIVLLNDVLSRMVEVYQQNPNAGTIGCRLHYMDESIQHNGIFVTRDGKLGHVDFRKTSGYRTDTNYNSIGNTAALMLISRYLFNKIGGFNPNCEDCFEDVVLNLECLLQGKTNITTSEAVAIHYESITRNKNKDKNKRMGDDYIKIFYPFFNKNKERLKRYL